VTDSPDMSHVRLGTRGSPLALFQAQAVARLLREHSGVTCDIVVIKTSGDRLAEAALSEAGGKRLFVKEIQDALLAGDVDLAVHSSKDMPVVPPEGLGLGAVLPREDPRDALVLPEGADAGGDIDVLLGQLGTAPRIGTGSVRRSAQLARVSPGARFLPVRGNLDTRLRKLDAGGYDALVLAAAGLRRLGYQARLSAALPVDVCVPAPGQGIIAIEIRNRDRQLKATLAAIDDRSAAVALAAERAVVERLGGGCQMPLGAYAQVTGDRVSVVSVVISPDGSRVARAESVGSVRDPAGVGAQSADTLLAGGAGDILAEARRILGMER